MALGIDSHSSGFTEVHIRWKFQGIRNRLKFDFRYDGGGILADGPRLLRKHGTGDAEKQQKVNSYHHNLRVAQDYGVFVAKLYHRLGDT